MIAQSGEPMGEIAAMARVEPHILAVLVNLQAPAVELDLVDPPGARWRNDTKHGDTRRNEARHSGHVGSQRQAGKAVA
jgi:hypothetical protein